MLASMSADQFVSWQAFERVEPFGFPWQNWTQANVRALLDWALHKERREDYRTPAQLKWKPPEPLFVARLKKRAKDRKDRNDRRSSKVRRPR